MKVCLYVYTYMRIDRCTPSKYTYTYIYIYIYIYVYMCIYIYVYIFMFIYIYMYTYIYIYVYTDIYIYTYIYIYKYVYIQYMYIHLHLYVHIWQCVVHPHEISDTKEHNYQKTKSIWPCHGFPPGLMAQVRLDWNRKAYDIGHFQWWVRALWLALEEPPGP